MFEKGFGRDARNNPRDAGATNRILIVHSHYFNESASPALLIPNAASLPECILSWLS
jgi:hypothetical protein